MIESEQIHAIAELDDRKHCAHFPDVWERRGTDGDSDLYCIKCEEYLHNMRTPDYLHSLDAIVPVIRKQTESMQSKVAFELCKLLGITSWTCSHSTAKMAIKSTPAQICEALLRGHEKWKE